MGSRSIEKLSQIVAHRFTGLSFSDGLIPLYPFQYRFETQRQKGRNEYCGLITADLCASLSLRGWRAHRS
jgi:hypothetical protein